LWTVGWIWCRPLRRRILQARLLHDESQRQGGRHSQTGHGEHGGRVAAVCGALAHIRVVLLKDSAVAVLVLSVVLPAAATDHSLLSTHILVDLPAEVILVIWAGLQVSARLRHVRLVRMVERIFTIDVCVARALMT